MLGPEEKGDALVLCFGGVVGHGVGPGVFGVLVAWSCFLHAFYNCTLILCYFFLFCLGNTYGLQWG